MDQIFPYGHFCDPSGILLKKYGCQTPAFFSVFQCFLDHREEERLYLIKIKILIFDFTKYFTVQSHPEESLEESTEVISASVIKRQQSIEDWEENWLFRKKRPQHLKTNMASTTSLTMLTDDPVAMLVPFPNLEAEAKALIGKVS